MDIKARCILSVVSVLAGSLFAFVGYTFGPLLPYYLWLPLLAALSFVILPWSRLSWSQEALEQDLKNYHKVLDELKEVQPKIEELSKEIEEKGILSQDGITEAANRFEQARQLSPESTQCLRELMFSTYRRMLAIQVLIMLIAALGGALLVRSLSA